ncbi:hypothetical protein RJ40_10320 [Methanofollis aquaemaris]|uniref:Uncharacterized protein n=2 Tax=Methanofollis aquaemaris TaxID=126734 RepID=A0A8A3S749_9EURY|nr:hypothetical protein RJ40_10320 [Methanofollis aquaemaris]
MMGGVGKELKRRTKVVEAFPNGESLLRRVGSIQLIKASRIAFIIRIRRVL